jgi:hypothetical protein
LITAVVFSVGAVVEVNAGTAAALVWAGDWIFSVRPPHEEKMKVQTRMITRKTIIFFTYALLIQN